MNASSAGLVATDSLAAGTELIVDRLAYRHHGIYLGEGLVIHYAGRTRYQHGLIETIPLRFLPVASPGTTAWQIAGAVRGER